MFYLNKKIYILLRFLFIYINIVLTLTQFISDHITSKYLYYMIQKSNTLKIRYKYCNPLMWSVGRILEKYFQSTYEVPTRYKTSKLGSNMTCLYIRHITIFAVHNIHYTRLDSNYIIKTLSNYMRITIMKPFDSNILMNFLPIPILHI